MMSGEVWTSIADPFFYNSTALLSPSIELSHGLKLPRLGLGTAGLRESTREITKIALNYGIQLLDTAQAREWYDEKSLGLGIEEFVKVVSNNTIAKLFDGLVVVTKIHPRSFRFDKMEMMVSASHHSIYRKHYEDKEALDVVLLHSPNCWSGHCTAEEETHDWRKGWRNLEALKSAGKISAIGVSNFNLKQLDELYSLSNSKISVVQNWMDPFNQDVKVREYCHKNNIAYMAYSSFGTQWEGKLRKNPVFTSSILQAIADKYRTSIAQVVLSWALQEGVVSIPRASNVQHVIANTMLLVKNESVGDKNIIGVRVFLEHEDIKKIRSLDGSIGSLW